MKSRLLSNSLSLDLILLQITYNGSGEGVVIWSKKEGIFTFFFFFKTYSKCQKLFHYELWFAAAPLIRLSGMTNLIHFYCPLPAIQMISVYRTTTGISHLKSFRKLIGWSSSTPLFLQTWLAIIDNNCFSHVLRNTTVYNEGKHCIHSYKKRSYQFEGYTSQNLPSL